MRPERPSPPVHPAAREREQLATFLVVMLSLVFGGSFVLFLIFVSLGLFLWVIVTAAGIAVFTALHYLIWGRFARGHRPNDGSAVDATPPQPNPLPDQRIRDDDPSD